MEGLGIRATNFTVYDLLSFVCIISIPPLVGIYFGWKSRKNESLNRYFYGDKRMHPVAVGVSTAVTSISAFTIISYPSEAYIVGTVLFWSPIAIAISAIVSAYVCVPFFHKLQLPTVYTYLELRFNATTRRMVAVIQTINEIVYLAGVMYLPSVAISAVTPISTTSSILLVGGTCTFYTALGGIRAVIWSDVIQCFFMITGCLMIMIKGVQTLGGMDNVMQVVRNGDRATFTEFGNFDASSRMHPVSIFLGQFLTYFKVFSFTQPMHQRHLSCKTTRHAQISMLSYLFPSALLICVSTFNGLIMYAYFADCDPIKFGLLEKYDQVLSYMVQSEFRMIPGMAGIFVAGVFSGTLSTVSSFLSSCSMVFVEDFAVAVFPSLSQKKKLCIGKICAVSLGLLVIGLSFLISTMDEDIFKVLTSFSGTLSGAIIGIFILGIFTPWTTSLGAVTGGSIGMATLLWIYLGSTFWSHVKPWVTLPPVSVDGCAAMMNVTVYNSTSYEQTVTLTTTTQSKLLYEDANEYTFDQMAYSLSFHYYVPLGVLLTLFFGLLTSFISGAQKAKDANPHLFMPLVTNPCFPKNLRSFFSLGVQSQIHEPCESLKKLQSEAQTENWLT